MPDNPPLGPSGQPSNPNPFQQGASANLSINTSSAQKAMEDLQRSLEGMMKSFGGTWNKVTSDRLAAEERLYRAVGDKARARQTELKRYSDEAIALINEETNAKIKGYELEKHSQDDIARYKKDLLTKSAEDRLRIETEVSRKLSREHGIGGLIRGRAGAISEAIGGGPIGGLITGAAGILTNPYALIGTAILEMLNTKAAFTGTGAQLAGAGLRLGAGAGAGLGFATGLFNQSAFGPAGLLGQALSADQQRSIIGTMSGSRTMIDQARASGGFGAIAGNLGLFANILPDASKEMEIFTDQVKNLGMSQKDISNTFISSRVVSEKLKTGQLDTLQTQNEMIRSLRNITNDGVVAADVLDNVGGFLKSLGTMNEAERLRITSGIGQAGANLSLPQIAGMFAFTRGRMPNLQTEVFGEGGVLKHGGVFGLMGGFLQQVGHQFRDPNQRLFAADMLRQQFMPGLRLQDVPEFFNIANAMQQPGANMENLTRRFVALEHKTPAQAAAEGIATLANIVDPIKRLENVFSNFWTMLDDRINKIVSSIPGMSAFHLTSYMPKGRMSPRDIGRFAAPADYYKNH